MSPGGIAPQIPNLPAYSAPLLTIEGSLTPVELRERYRDLRFSGLYAFYALSALVDIPSRFTDLTHHSADWVLLYVGQAQMRSHNRYLGVRCHKHCGGVSYEAQSQLRIGLCGILLESLLLKPCFKERKRGKGTFIHLDPGQKLVFDKVVRSPRGLNMRRLQICPDGADDEETLIRQLLPPQYRTPIHPFTPQLKKLKRTFTIAGGNRPYPR